MKRGILLVAYGSGNLRGTTALRAVQAAAEARFRLPVRWAFTSETMRIRLARSRTKSDSVLKALNRMRFERYTHVAVQTLHLIPGDEYTGVAADCRAAMDSGFQVSLGQPMLTGSTPDHPSIRIAAETLLRHISPLRSPEEPVICMAHGSRHECDILFRRWEQLVHSLDPLVHVTCMISPDTPRGIPLEDVPDGLDLFLPELASQLPESRRVWLLPLLSLVGRHTLEDMAGASPDSWKSRIEAIGGCCQAELRGLADDPAFVDLWLDRLEEALAAFDAPAVVPAGVATADPTGVAADVPADAPATDPAGVQVAFSPAQAEARPATAGPQSIQAEARPATAEPQPFPADARPADITGAEAAPALEAGAGEPSPAPASPLFSDTSA